MRVTSLEVRLEELLSYWQLLDASVRVDKAVAAQLRAERDSIEATAVAIANRIRGMASPAENIVDVRFLVRERITSSTQQLIDDIEFGGGLPGMSAAVREIVLEAQRLGAHLFASVDLLTLTCTSNVRARRTLVAQLRHEDRTAFIDAGASLCRLTCAAATQALVRGLHHASRPAGTTATGDARRLN